MDRVAKQIFKKLKNPEFFNGEKRRRGPPFSVED
jgi:hypothetical protein